MIGFVSLQLKRNRGWPWPESSFGLDPMFGEDGWCRSCGVPRHPQTGSLVLQRKAMRPGGAWVPNWQFDVLCVEGALGARLDERFRLDLRPVRWHGEPPGDASQIVIPSAGPDWFSPDDLASRAEARNGYAGRKCAECGIWKWSPVPFESLPVLRAPSSLENFDVVASPEWFGAGLNAYREIVMRRELAEALAEASPRDFRVATVAWATT